MNAVTTNNAVTAGAISQRGESAIFPDETAARARVASNKVPMERSMSSMQTNGKKQQQDLQVERAVADRYSAASRAVETELCCPVAYDAKYLDVLPQELIERDYGCGDPSQFVAAGETVLDLGSGRRQDLLYRVADRRARADEWSAST